MKKILLLIFVINISVFGAETLNRIFPMKKYYIEGKAFTGTLEYGDLEKNEPKEPDKKENKKNTKKHIYMERGEYKDGFLEKAAAYLDGKEIGYIIYDKGKLVSEYIEGNSEYISEENAPTLKLLMNDNTVGLLFMDIYKGKESVKVENGKTVYKQFKDDKVFEIEYKHIVTDENLNENYYTLDTKTGVSAREYKNGILTGEIIEKENTTGDMIADIKTYYDDGTPMTQAEFINRKQTGENITYFSNGQIETKGTYEDGRNAGVLKKYYPNGNLYQEIKYNKDGLSGKIKEYYDTGELYGEGYVAYNKKSNNFKVYDKEKNLLKEVYYFKGEPVSIEYTEKGKKYYKEYVEEYKYVKNGITDTIKYAEKSSYNSYNEEENQSKREGEYEIYYDNGFLKEKVVYVNGRKTGKVQNYDRNGSKSEVVDYDETNEIEDINKKRKEKLGKINERKIKVYKTGNVLLTIINTVLIVLIGVIILKRINHLFSKK